jgi:hypothetical protein
MVKPTCIRRLLQAVFPNNPWFREQGLLVFYLSCSKAGTHARP